MISSVGSQSTGRPGYLILSAEVIILGWLRAAKSMLTTWEDGGWFSYFPETVI